MRSSDILGEESADQTAVAVAANFAAQMMPFIKTVCFSKIIDVFFFCLGVLKHHLNGANSHIFGQIHVLLVSFAPMLRATSQNEDGSDKKHRSLSGLRIRDCLKLKRFGRRETTKIPRVR